MGRLATCNFLAPELTSHPHLGGDTGDPDNPAVLDQLFCAYQDSHETDPPEIKDGFAELESFLETLPLEDNNAV